MAHDRGRLHHRRLVGAGIAVAAVALSGLLVRAFAIGRGRVAAEQAVLPPVGRRLVPLPAGAAGEVPPPPADGPDGAAPGEGAPR